MKRSLIRLRNFSLAFCALASAAVSLALSDAEWKYQQAFPVERAGVERIALPLETLDHAQSDLRDLRVVAPDGGEVPFALIRPSRAPARWLAAPHYDIALKSGTTVITINTGGEKIWEAIELHTPTSSFLKAVQIEASLDGQTWTTWQEGAPLFRKDGAQQTILILPRKSAAQLRLTLDDRRQAAIIVTGVSLREPPSEEIHLETLNVRIARTDDYATESALTLELPAANLDLDSVEVVTSDRLFTRQVRAGWSEFENGEIRERMVGTDTLFRFQLDDGPPAEKTRATFSASLPSREVVLHVENGNSPPLRIEAIKAARQLVYLVFEARTAGRYALWSGNPDAAAPRYDLALAVEKLREVPPFSVPFEPSIENPRYRRSDPLAGLFLEGPSVPSAEWSVRREVQLAGAGVHILELDLPALASAQPSLADLRLVRGDKQVPYVVERTKLFRTIDLAAVTEPDPKTPTLSRWHLSLQQPKTPITQIALSSSASLFQREIRVVERRAATNGETYAIDLGRAVWQRTPQDPTTPLVVPIVLPQTSQLWIETDNGDNPPIPLTQVKAFHPVVRLLFRAEANDHLSLLSGNPKVPAPRYDLALVARALLASEKHAATLASASAAVAVTANPVASKTILFWTVLALVVAALLFVVAKLLPKPPQ